MSSIENYGRKHKIIMDVWKYRKRNDPKDKGFNHCKCKTRYGYCLGSNKTVIQLLVICYECNNTNISLTNEVILV